MSNKEKTSFFYMWRHPYTNKTCYGITSNLDDRNRAYRGHNGFDVDWCFLIEGPLVEINKLERTLKKKLTEVERGLNKKITYGNYEWISEEVEYQTIEGLIEFFMQNDNYQGLKLLIAQNIKN
jgi:hypothetical protein